MLVISYDTECLQDGFGAQLQRYLGLLGICKEYGIAYYHVPLTGVNYHGINSLLNSEIYAEDFVQDCNSRIKISNDTDDVFCFQTVNVKQLTPEILQKYIEQGKDTSIWLRVCIPFILPDRICQAVKEEPEAYLVKTHKNEVFTVGVHVRRGDIAFLETNIRFLPTSYYVEQVKKLLPELPDEYIIEIYTEIPDELLFDDKIEIELDLGDKVPAEFKSDRPTIVLQSKLYDISELVSLEHTVLYNNEDVFTTLDRMINCDVLITSKSSLSAVAAFLKPVVVGGSTGRVVYKPFWTPMPSYAEPCK